MAAKLLLAFSSVSEDFDQFFDMMNKSLANSDSTELSRGQLEIEVERLRKESLQAESKLLCKDIEISDYTKYASHYHNDKVSLINSAIKEFCISSSSISLKYELEIQRGNQRSQIREINGS